MDCVCLFESVHLGVKDCQIIMITLLFWTKMLDFFSRPFWVENDWFFRFRDHIFLHIVVIPPQFESYNKYRNLQGKEIKHTQRIDPQVSTPCSNFWDETYDGKENVDYQKCGKDSFETFLSVFFLIFSCFLYKIIYASNLTYACT